MFGTTIIKREPPRQPPAGPPATSPASPEPGRGSQREEYEELHRLEKGVAAHRMSWVIAGRSLAEIQRRELYRVRAASFEQYLKERWNLSRRHGLDLVTAATVADNVQEVKHGLSLRAALKLARLPADQQADCLAAAIAAGGTRTPTADYLAAAVAARLPQPTADKPRRRRNKKPKPYRIRLASGTLTILAKNAGIDLRALLEEALAQLAKPAAA